MQYLWDELVSQVGDYVAEGTTLEDWQPNRIGPLNPWRPVGHPRRQYPEISYE
jgi:hypothetical protein